MTEASLSTCLLCPVCHETFQRAEHLKRHALTHNDERPHVCQYCNLQYKRSDALRRHWKTCSERIAAGHDIPRRSLSGKRKQACDSCTSRKRACSTGMPCDECAMRETECTYHRAHRQKAVSFEEPNNAQQTTKISGPGLWGIESGGPGNPISRFGFLAHFTKATGLNEAYSYRPTDSATPSLGGIESDIQSEYVDSTASSNPFDAYLNEFGLDLDADATFMKDAENTSITQKANEIWNSIQQVSLDSRMHRPKPSSTEWFSFFSPVNVAHYLDLFWSRWYQHCPIVHKATFALGGCSPLLLATMILIGACMSSPSSDHDTARQFLDVIEEVIFSHSLFMESPRVGASNENLLQTRENIQVLQATCFMCLLQKWEGSSTAKLRMQRHRFTAFTTRTMGLSQAVHPVVEPDASLSVEDWHNFALKAQMIRTFNHVFLLDSAFVIFHNSVPRMVLQEMTIDLTCPEVVFQAASLKDFKDALMRHKSRTPPPLLTDCVRNLCAEAPNPEVIAHLHNESALNLFTIATAIHGLIFHQLRAFSPLPLATNPLRRALDRWEKAWNSSIGKLQPLNSGNVVAFPLQAREFAALARVHIEKCHLSPAQWHAMLQQLPGNVAVESRDNLATFDQTGMDQVANLILAVEHLGLQ
ncbi:Zn(II)2Cys6 transcription factor [Aspergillus stella-maris]|uniref:Zn(II)2Cys6 transcription factor n=1 Tax=Aspergillus stella-maris TaxID=1810926 RepID=UPI003CCD8FD2